METAVRWSHSSVAGNERLLFVDVAGKSFSLCRVRCRKKGVLQYDILSERQKVPAFRAFDWSPTHEGVVAVGQLSGEATVLRIDDGSQAVLSFPVRSERFCNAIAFNNQGLLAAGLDRVRTDHCLNIWDLQQQLPSGSTSGFVTSSGRTYPEPLQKLASSEPITSIKFFRNEPRTLVAGVKGQFVRLYDLREAPGSTSMQFPTRCVSNVAIDSMDENYFASCYPTNGATICIWDRRTGSRPPMAQAGFFSASGESTPYRASLELKNATEAPGSIWSLRFSGTRRGCLVMLSSAGHFRTYDIGKEFPQTNVSSESKAEQLESQSITVPEDLYLHGTQDLQHAHDHPKEGRLKKDRIVSFDFMNTGGTWNEPKVITLTGNGCMAELSIPMVPEPEVFSSIGLIHKGAKQVQRPSDPVNVVFGHFNNIPATKVKPGGTELPGAVEMLLQYIRCKKGYLFSLQKNQAICSELPQLMDLWVWLEWAHKEHLAGTTVHDDLDLSYLGVHAIWMDDLGPGPYNTRSLGPSTINVAKVIKNLVQHHNIPETKTCSTDYEFHRRLCLYTLQQAWTYEQLEELVSELVSQNHHTKAAAMAVFANETKLAYRALRSSPVQSDKMIAMAIVSATKRAVGNNDEDNDGWMETIEVVAKDITDPFARAILTFVKKGDWNAVIEEETLPLPYRIGVAIRWFNDSTLTQYISRITKEVVNSGNIGGIVLTGLRTRAAFELLGNYMRHSGDLQTSVLALTWTVPRYLDDTKLVRKFLAWRETYRDFMNSWNLCFDRVDFDIISSRVSVDADGQCLLRPPKPQVALSCGYCKQSIAHFDQGSGDDGAAATIQQTQKHPLSSEKASAIGTVCPKCGRRLPRCGVCDMELGMPDPSYLKWFARGQKQGSVDLSASLAGSVVTTLGPGTTRSKAGSEPPDGNRSKAGSDLAEMNSSKPGSDQPVKRSQELAPSKPVDQEMLRKFIAFCIKCSHGFHANHAMDWFRGVSGRQGHSVCPVSECSCVCDV